MKKNEANILSLTIIGLISLLNLIQFISIFDVGSLTVFLLGLFISIIYLSKKNLHFQLIKFWILAQVIQLHTGELLYIPNQYPIQLYFGGSFTINNLGIGVNLLPLLFLIAIPPLQHANLLDTNVSVNAQGASEKYNFSFPLKGIIIRFEKLEKTRQRWAIVQLETPIEINDKFFDCIQISPKNVKIYTVASTEPSFVKLYNSSKRKGMTIKGNFLVTLNK